LVGLLVLLGLGVSGFIFFFQGKRFFSRLFPGAGQTQQVVLASDYPGYQLEWENQQFFLTKLDVFGFWKANSPTKEKSLKKTTFKKLVINLTDKQQTFDKIKTSGFQGPIRTLGASYEDNYQTLVLNVHISPELVTSLSQEEMNLLLGIGVLRGAYIFSREGPTQQTHLDFLSTLEQDLGSKNKIFIKALKKSSFNLLKALTAVFSPPPALGACQGNY